MNAIPIIPKPEYKVDAALYFLDGQYLFKSFGERTSAKFVTAKDVQSAFDGREEDTGWLAPGVVRVGHNTDGDWYVYSTPPQLVDIHLETKIGIETIQIPIPRLALAGIGGHFYLWALADKAFDPKAEAFRAPFPNVYDEGKICWGNNLAPAIRIGDARAPWKLFFDAPFNAHLSTGKSEKYPVDVRLGLAALAERKARKYPVGDLVPTEDTIGITIKRLLRAV